MAQVTLSPSTIVDNPDIGTIVWNFPGNAISQNSIYTEANLGQNNTSHYLRATNFSFSITIGARIDGIVVEVLRQENANLDNIFDNAIRIVRGGVIGTTDRSSSTEWGINVSTYVSYGSSTDLWGTTWSAAQINAANFGVALSAKAVNGSLFTSAQIDHIRITVYYSETGSTTTSTSTSTTSTSTSSTSSSTSTTSTSSSTSTSTSSTTSTSTSTTSTSSSTSTSTSSSTSTSTSTTSTSSSTSTTSTSTSTTSTSTSTTSTSTSTTTTYPFKGDFRVEQMV